MVGSAHPTYSSETRKEAGRLIATRTIAFAIRSVDPYSYVSLVEAWLGRPLVGVRRGQ